jgi:hypothetical protein
MRLCTDVEFLIADLPPSPGQRACFNAGLELAGFSASGFTAA